MGTSGLGRKPREQARLSLAAEADQHLAADALGRLRPSGVRVTTDLELVRSLRIRLKNLANVD